MFPGAHAAETPDKPAIIMGSGEITTYRELDDEANRLSQLFRAAGLGVGDHIAFSLENGPRFLAVAWGAHYAGLYYTAISTRLTAEETAYVVDDCGARVFLAGAERAEVAEAIVADTPRVELRLVVGGGAAGHEGYEDAIAAHPADPLPDRIGGRDMLYSSGTTGRPKGVKPAMPSDPLDTATAVTTLCQLLLSMDADSTYLSPAPLYHAAPLRFTMSAHQLGATAVVMEHFDAEGCLDLIGRHHVTHAQFVPTMFVRMLKLPDEVRAAADVSSLRGVFHAAAPCPIEVKERMIDWWGPIIHEYYAGTEGNGFVYTSSEDWLTHKGSVGKAIIGEIHICDEKGEEVPVGDEGTIWFANGGVFEYHNDPEKTAESRDERGWSTLGDVGRLDEDGFLYLTDRKAYMIISGGVNIYPQEAENTLTLHPSVFDVAVIGVPDPEMGEQVKAVVQPVDMAEAGPELEAELLAFCRDHLTHLKCPRSVDFVEELPRHPTGKLYKRLLRDRYWEGHASRLV